MGDAVSILCMGTLSLWERTLQWLHVQESLAVSVKKVKGGSSRKKASDVYFPAMGPRCPFPFFIVFSFPTSFSSLEGMEDRRRLTFSLNEPSGGFPVKCQVVCCRPVGEHRCGSRVPRPWVPSSPGTSVVHGAVEGCLPLPDAATSSWCSRVTNSLIHVGGVPVHVLVVYLHNTHICLKLGGDTKYVSANTVSSDGCVIACMGDL